jgi:two-component system, chemotaxis family, protein-glutamate methylesterase/glutaminase
MSFTHKPSSEGHAPAGLSAGSPASPSAIRVLVCDDSAFMRKAISGLINSDPGLSVIDTARNGEELVEKVKRLAPDVVTLDIEMPVLNGHQALKRIMRECREMVGGPPAVLVCSSLTSAGSHDALEAMREGAADIIAKDQSFFSTQMNSMRDDLIRKIKAIARPCKRVPMIDPGAKAAAALTNNPWVRGAAERPAAIFTKDVGRFGDVTPTELSLKGRAVSLVAIGSSTGGPPMLELILGQLPADLPCPVVIAQHMPRSFTKAMSERIDGLSPMSVVHGEHGMPLHPGTAYIIPGQQHGRVRAIGRGPLRLEVSDEPISAPFKPSVNELLASVAEQCGARGVGAVLTGIGDDGRLGGAALLKAGGLLLAQDPRSSVVYGMPKAAAEVGGKIMTPDQIARTIATLGSSGLNLGSVAA